VLKGARGMDSMVRETCHRVEVALATRRGCPSAHYLRMLPHDPVNETQYFAKAVRDNAVLQSRRAGDTAPARLAVARVGVIPVADIRRLHSKTILAIMPLSSWLSRWQ